MRRILSFVFLFLVTLSLHADGGMWGQRGFSRAFVVQGNILYAADGRGVAVYDVSAPDSVSRVDLEWSDAETRDLALMGNDLVVATSDGVERFAVAGNGLLTRLGSFSDSGGAPTRIAANARYAAAASGRTVSILERDGTSLSLARRITLTADVTALAFVGDHLYVASDNEPLRVFVPPSATAVALLPGLSAEAFSVANGVLWAVSFDDGLVGLDVSTPANPKAIASAGRGVLRLRGVAAAGSRVFAFESPNKVHVFDASTPAEPRLVATMNEWVNVIAASGTRLFLAGAVIEESGLAYDPGLIPRETGKPVRVFVGLTPVAEYTDLAGPVSGVWTDGSVAYVVDPPYLRVLDVSKSSEPREVMSLAIENIQDKIRVKNGRAILYGRAYVNYLDVSTPLRPRLLSTWDAQGHPPSGAAILHDRIIEVNEHSGMHIVDFSDPTRGVQIGGRKWHYHGVAAGVDAAYALMRDLMLVVEIADERTVIDRSLVHIKYDQVDTVPPNAAAPHSLLVRGEEGLRLYSIEGEARFAPQEIGFLPRTGLGVFGTNEGSAYIAKDGRLHFVDLPDLTLQDTGMRVTSPMEISVAGEKIVIADRYSVRVYGPDTAPPPAPPEPPKKRRSSRH